MFSKLEWAFALRIKPVEKVILLALVKMADRDGKSHPSIRTLAWQCCVSERTVQRALKRFEANGWLKVETRWRPNAGQSSNSYQLLVAYPENNPHPTANLSSSPRRNVRGGVTQLCHPPDDIAVSPQELPSELSIEDVVREQAVNNGKLKMPERFNAEESAEAAALLHDITLDAAQSLLDEVAAAIRIPGRIKTTPMQFLRGLVKKQKTGDFRPYLGKQLTAYAVHRENASEAVRSANRSNATAHLAQIKRMLHATTSAPTERDTTGPPSSHHSA